MSLAILGDFVGSTKEPVGTVNKRAESREPRAESREPRAESREPRAESREPRAESREPRAESREPRAESREPRAESREPRAESREPRAEIWNKVPNHGRGTVAASRVGGQGRPRAAWRRGDANCAHVGRRWYTLAGGRGAGPVERRGCRGRGNGPQEQRFIGWLGIRTGVRQSSARAAGAQLKGDSSCHRSNLTLEDQRATRRAEFSADRFGGAAASRRSRFLLRPSLFSSWRQG